MSAFKKILEKRLQEYAYPYKNPWWRLILHVVIAICVPLYYLFTNDVTMYFKVMFIVFSNDMVQGVAHIYTHHRLERTYSWIDEPVKRSLWGVFWHLLVAMVLYLVVGVFDQWLLFNISPAKSFFFLLHYWFIPVGIITLVMIFSIAGEFWKRWKASLVNEQKVKAEMMTYKYESLKSQMNPHFLFNSFNVLQNLVDQDQQLAKEFIVKLSQLYRKVLDVGESELIPLGDEIEFVSSYIFLLKIRFEDKLDVKIAVDFKEEDMVVPMVLQTLIENAVKHNVTSRDEPLRICVRRQDDSITVTNSLNVIKVKMDSSKLGLKNIRQRYEYFTSDPIKIEQTSEQFAVTIPIVKMA